MWQQLALAGIKSVQDNNNRKNFNESQVINQKYSPWTGLKGNFSQIGQNNTISNLMQGYASGLIQDQLDAEKAAETAAQQKAEYKSDADFYSKLSANPSSVGVSPVGGGKSSFAAVARAAAPQAQQAAAQTLASPTSMMDEDPYIFSDRKPSGFLSQLGVNEGALKQSMAATPAQQSINPWGNLSQQLQRPLSPMEAQLPAQEQKRFDPTSAGRAAVVNALPASVPLFASIKGEEIQPSSSFSNLASTMRGRTGDFMNEQPRTYAPMQFPKIINPGRRPY